MPRRDLAAAGGHTARCATLGEGGKLAMPVLAMHGEVSAFTPVTEDMGREIADRPEVVEVPDTGHWMAEENPPTALVDILTRFDTVRN